MSQLPRFKVKYGEGIGNELFIEFPDLSNNEKSFFDADEAVGQTTLSASGANFAANDYVVLGTPKTEKCEILKVSSVSSTTIVVSSATAFAHSRGDQIVQIPYNQIVISRSTDSGSSYTPLTAVDIRPDASETYIPRTSDASTDYYKFRFYNATTALYSAYSDPTIATGLAFNSVGMIKQRALDDLGEKKNDLITDEYLNQALWNARRELDSDERVYRWSFRTKFNQDLGDIIPGRWSVAVPTDLRDKNTNKNILSLRVGRYDIPLEYQDITRFNQNYQNIGHSTLNGAITPASTSITLTSSGDFDESGSAYIAGEDVNDVLDAVSYTANDESTNVLSGVTAITANHASGRDIWQGTTNFGLPRAYTIYEGSIYFDVPFADLYAGENIKSDYYSELPVYDSDADLLDEPDIDPFVAYLRFRIKYKKSNGSLKREEDSDWKEWEAGKKSMVNTDITGQTIRLIPS